MMISPLIRSTQISPLEHHLLLGYYLNLIIVSINFYLLLIKISFFDNIGSVSNNFVLHKQHFITPKSITFQQLAVILNFFSTAQISLKKIKRRKRLNIEKIYYPYSKINSLRHILLKDHKG